jgi:hypothetical protein
MHSNKRFSLAALTAQRLGLSLRPVRVCQGDHPPPDRQKPSNFNAPSGVSEETGGVSRYAAENPLKWGDFQSRAEHSFTPDTPDTPDNSIKNKELPCHGGVTERDTPLTEPAARRFNANACIHCGRHCVPSNLENWIGPDGWWVHLDCELAQP